MLPTYVLVQETKKKIALGMKRRKKLNLPLLLNKREMPFPYGCMKDHQENIHKKSSIVAVELYIGNW